MFYFDEDKREIRGWLSNADDKLREELRIEFQTEIRNQQNNFISAQQLAQYDVEFQSRVEVVIGNKTRENNYWVTEKINAVQKIFDDFKTNEFDALKNSSAATSAQVDALKKQIAALKISESAPSSGELNAVQKIFDDFKANEFDPLKNFSATTSAQVDALKVELDALKSQTPSAEIDALSAENDALKKQVARQAQNLDALKNAVATALTDIQKNFFALLQQRDTKIAALQKEIDNLQAAAKPSDEIKSLRDELAALTERVANLEPPPEIPDDEKFFLPEQSTEFLPADAKKISSKVKQASNLSELEKFLSANPLTTSKQFQKLIAMHLKEVKKFVDRLKLDDLEDSEISETVTAKFFKLFQRTIFDNIMIATRHGLKSSDPDTKKFYSDFLGKLNEYLTRCGIYSLNVKGDRPAESDDYENMTPQIIKTADKNLSGKIESIERVPYRINYLDEFGEKNFFQYAGVMNVYKAV